MARRGFTGWSTSRTSRWSFRVVTMAFGWVEQYRYAVGRRACEFPQGSWSPGRHGPASELARAELREETGLSAGSWTHLGHLFTAYGFCSQGFDVYLAEDLDTRS